MARRSAAALRIQPADTEPPSDRHSDRFLAGLENTSRVTFVSHVHPDPDSLGSMMGLAHLVESCLGLPTRLTRDGHDKIIAIDFRAVAVTSHSQIR